MFLHIGADLEILAKDIVCIMNLETANHSSKTKSFINMAEKKDEIVGVKDDKVKSVVVVNSQGKNKLYLSPINSVTLQHRLVSLYTNKYEI